MSLADSDRLNSVYIRDTTHNISAKGIAHSSAVVHPRGTVILSRDAGVGKSAILAEDMAVSQHFMAWTCGPRLSNLFLYYWLQSRADEFERIAIGNTIKTIGVPYFRNLTIPLPSRAEQEAIAECLFELDRFIDALNKIIAKKQAMRQEMLHTLLGGRRRLPGYAAEWRMVRLGDHVNYVKTVPLSRAQLDASSPVSYLHYGDIHTRLGVKLHAGRDVLPRAPQSLIQRAGRLRVGDLVFADASEDTTGLGRSVEVSSLPSGGLVAGLHTIVARFDKAILADGFKAYLQFVPGFHRALVRLAAGTKVLATTRSYISSIALLVPEPEEQTAIASVLDDVDAEIGLLQRRIDKTRAIKTGVAQSLLAGHVRLPTGAHA